MKKKSPLPEHIELYRAELSCKIGKDALDDKISFPENVTPAEYALYNLLSAVEDIAKFLAKEK